MNAHTFVLGLGLSIATSCSLFIEPAPNVDQPKTYSDHGVTYDYPGNWKVSEESMNEGGTEITTITVESPGSTIAIVQVFDSPIDIEMDMLVDEFQKGMSSALSAQFGGIVTVEQRDRVPTERNILGGSREGRKARFDVAILGEKVPHTVDLYGMKLTERTIALYLQAPDEDVEKVKPGFDLVLDTLREQ